MRIHYSSSPCGSGKTYQLVARACAMAKKHMVVILVQPTIELINKTINEELLTRNDFPMHQVFHSQSVGKKSVAAELAEYLKSRDDYGQIIFTTHQVLQFVRYWTNKHDLHLLIDEDLQVVRYDNLRLPDMHHLVTEHLSIAPYNATYGRVEVDDLEAVEATARNKGDDAVLAVFSDTLRIIANAHWETFVNQEQYKALLRGDAETLAFHSLLQPSLLNGFGSVFMAAARFEDTFVHQLWTDAGLEFGQDANFASQLRYTDHPNGALMTFYYVTERPWSKRYRKQRVEDISIQNLMMAGAAKLFTDTNFVWQANAEYTGNPFGTQGIRLPNKPHGLNEYSHLNDIVFASSLNPNPDHISFLNSRGLSSEQIRAAIYYSTCYKSVMRISTRDPKSTHEKRIMVPDLGVAEYLQGLFPGSSIQWLDVGIPRCPVVKKGGRPKKHATNAARRSQQRKNAREELLNRLQDLISRKASQDHGISDGIFGEENGGAETPISIISPIGTAVFDSPILVSDGSIFLNKYQSKPFSLLSCANNDAFIATLHDIWSENVITHKEAENFLISPALFDPALSQEHDRGLDNVVYARHIWLDFENGDLRPDEFPKLFPQLRMAVFNSFSHTADKPRFRVVIPTTNIMTPEIYSIIQTHICSKLEQSGYTVETIKEATIRANSQRSGMDTGKRSPSSLFYLPCQAKGQKDSFFDYYEDDGREFLDAAVWVENSLIPIVPDEVEWLQHDFQQPDTINQDAVDAAIARWQTTPKGHGHAAFFQLAVDLRGAGMGAADIKANLQTQAQSARSKKERKAQISGVMSKLKSSRTPLKA